MNKSKWGIASLIGAAILALSASFAASAEVVQGPGITAAVSATQEFAAPPTAIVTTVQAEEVNHTPAYFSDRVDFRQSSDLTRAVKATFVPTLRTALVTADLMASRRSQSFSPHWLA